MCGGGKATLPRGGNSPPTRVVVGADLYAILKTTDKLERAYVRDAIKPDEYEAACEKLIAQFKVLQASIRGQV